MNGFIRELQACLRRPLGSSFTIRDLILWTAIIALLIGLYKLELWLGEDGWILPAVTSLFAVIMIMGLSLRRKK